MRLEASALFGDPWYAERDEKKEPIVFSQSFTARFFSFHYDWTRCSRIPHLMFCPP